MDPVYYVINFGISPWILTIEFFQWPWPVLITKNKHLLDIKLQPIFSILYISHQVYACISYKGNKILQTNTGVRNWSLDTDIQNMLSMCRYMKKVHKWPTARTIFLCQIVGTTLPFSGRYNIHIEINVKRNSQGHKTCLFSSIVCTELG